MKKIISTILLLLLIITNNIVFITNAVNTNEQSSPWTIEKAEHLAKKTLYWATKEKVQELFNAWSANAAVNILFPSVQWPDRTTYNTKMQSLLNTDFLIETSKSEMREYYSFKKLEDPYEAKSKLFWLFEDTFSVDTKRERINYWEVEATHDLLYSHTLWNFKEMIKRNLYNNWNVWDYSLWEYLDLFNQTNPKYPNENYAREILQLFMMLEYKPTESEDQWSVRNYSEDDVNAMAKIIFWFETDENTHKVTYNTTANTNTTIEFLEWNLKNWDSFPFYNSASWVLDIQAMKTSVSWNNWLPDNTIDYIFSKRENEIAIFLADKLYRFYVAEDPSRTDLDIITNKVIENNFDIYPTVKWLLSNNMMYSEKSMNSVIYKNPLELIIWTAKILWLNSESLDLRYSLNNIWWTPYGAWKIFWRDWYDDNSVFFTPYISNKWTSESSKLASKLIDNNIDFFQNKTDANSIINELEDKLFLWKKVDSTTRTKLLNYLNQDKDWNNITIDFTDNQFVAKNIQGLIYIMLNQPEYVLQSWYDKSSTTSMNSNSFYNNNESKLVFIKASWWLDWLHAVIPKNEYNEYLALRLTWALTWTGLTSLDDKYYINSALNPFKKLYDDGNLKIINRVWTPYHSRWHDSASRKITSIDNTYKWTQWIFWDFIQNEDPSKTIVLDWGTKPSIFRNWNYMWIWSSAVYQINYWSTWIDSDEREHKITTLKDILKNRIYVWSFWEVFKNSAIIDDVARDSKANWWREWSGYNMQQKFTFLESLYKWWLWNTAWMRADWGYDTHRNQKEYLNKNLRKVSTSITNFFNSVKETNNVTIVVYSEFWRTNKLNASIWVDHGMAGWMFIISNNNELIKNELPKKVYWNLSFNKSKSNWLWVWIDYRSVYSAIYKAIYWIDISSRLWWIFNVNDYIDTNNWWTQLLWYDHKQYSWNSYYTHIKFDIDDKNYFWSQASYIKLEYWSDTDPVREVNKYTLARWLTWENKYDISIRTNWNKKYYYKLTILDNQFNEKIIEWNFKTPNSQSNLSKTSSVFLPNFKNINVENALILNNSATWIVLSETWTTELVWENNNKIIAWSWTFVTQIKGWTWALFSWVFLNPIEINKDSFIGSISAYLWDSIWKFQIDKLIKIWANTLWIKITLNKEVEVEVQWINSSYNYIIVTSEDWITWENLANPQIRKSNNKLIFKTNHFSYFAIVRIDSSWNPVLRIVSSNNINISSWGSWKSHRLVKDKCEYWDFSTSYYDRTCWIDPFTLHSNMYDSWKSDLFEDMYDDLKSDLKDLDWRNLKGFEIKKLKSEKEMEIAFIELKIKAEEKAEIFENIFTKQLVENKMIQVIKNDGIIENQEEEIIIEDIEIILTPEEIEAQKIEDKLNEYESRKSILILLREKLSFITIWDYELIHIKASKQNKIFQAIAKVVIRKHFSTEKTNYLMKALNNIVMYSAINNLESIDKYTKKTNKILLKNEIKKLVKKYKEKSIIKKVETKKETISEKIKRLNSKRKMIK